MSAYPRLMRALPGSWQRAELETCSARELSSLAILLGIPYSGTKARLIDRLLDIADLRTTLAGIDDPDVLVERYTAPQLRAMCKRAGTWRSGNKRQLSVALLNWRNECRVRGQRALETAKAQARAAAAGRPRQLRFAFDS